MSNKLFASHTEQHGSKRYKFKWKMCLEVRYSNAPMSRHISNQGIYSPVCICGPFFNLLVKSEESQGLWYLSDKRNTNGYLGVGGIVLFPPAILSGGVKSNLPPQREKMGWGPVFSFPSSGSIEKPGRPVTRPNSLNTKTWDKIKLLGLLWKDRNVLVWNFHC